MKLHKLYVVFAYLVCFYVTAAMEKSTKILHAARDGDTEQASQLLTNDPQLASVQDEYKQTPLHRASFWGRTKIAKLLLQYNADVNAQDKYKWTPLHIASCWGQTETAQLLLKHKADMNAQDKHKQTPLHIVSAQDRTETAKLLLSYGAIPYSPINLFENFSSFSKLYAQGHQTFINKVRKEREKVFLILYSIERKEGNKGGELPRELCYKIASLAFSGIQEWAQFKKAHPEIAELADAQEGKLP